MDKMFHSIDFKLDGNTFMQPGFIVTSPQVPGLLATGATIPQALEAAADALRDLAVAFAMEIAAGREVKPIFKDVPVAQPVEAQA